MPYCEKCEMDRESGTVYCTQCGFRLVDTEVLDQETPEHGMKMGEVAAAAQPVRRPVEVWRAIGLGGKVILIGALLALTGFFIPTTRVIPPGIVVTRSLAAAGGPFWVIPVLAAAVVFLVYLTGQRRPLRNRLFLLASIIAIGTFVIPSALIVWFSGLLGGLFVLLGFAAVAGGGYALMADSTRSLG